MLLIFFAGKDIITGEESNRMFLLFCVLAPEAFEQTGRILKKADALLEGTVKITAGKNFKYHFIRHKSY